MGQFYVTTPIYYVNDSPHIGHGYTTVVTDALARWHRLLGDDTFFLTGTDEHGLKVQRAAEAAGLAPAEHAGRIADTFREAAAALHASNDDFIRTSEPRHYAAVAEILQACHDNGAIALRTYEGLYSVSDEAYVDEAEAEELRARGKPVVEMKEDNYFFLLSEYQDRLEQWYLDHPDYVYPASRRNEALGLIRGGLQDFSISRTSIDWGVPIPWDDDHVTYVWFDALTNYITAAGYGSDPERFARQWPGYHVLGKDILRFHCVYWPAMLLAAGLDPPANLFVHGWLLVGGEKMSKTGLTQITAQSLVDEFGVDGVRYHLLADVVFGSDSEFSHEGIVARYNADLANNLGNLLSRVATVVGKKCDGVGPAPDPDSPLAAAAARAVTDASAAWLKPSPSEALAATWQLIREANAHLEANEPWKADPGPAVDAVLGDALEVLRIVAVLASAAVPDACAAIWERIGLDGRPDDRRVPDDVAWGGYPGGLTVTKGSPLFPRLSS